MRIFIRTSFEGIHAYEHAPDDVAFLRNPHRHNFGVYVEMDVFHEDRELEFILVKRFVTNQFKTKDYGNMSCEQIAHILLTVLIKEYGKRHYKVIIDEDGENGAIASEL